MPTGHISRRVNFIYGTDESLRWTTQSASPTVFVGEPFWAREQQALGWVVTGTVMRGIQNAAIDAGGRPADSWGTSGCDSRELYDRHKHQVYRVCMRFAAGNVAWAEDATHDVFVKALEQLERLEPGEDLGGWLYRVATNTCISRLRREGSIWGRARRVLVHREATRRRPTTPFEKTSRKQELSEFSATLGKLPPKERAVFAMRYLDDLSQQEICEQLGMSKGYVSKLLKRALARIRDHHVKD